MRSIPDAFVHTSLAALPPGERPALLDALVHGEPARGLRLRPGIPLAAIAPALPGPCPPVPWAAHAYYLDAASPAGSHPLHAAGAYYLQEPSAMAAVAALDVRPGQRVLDLCAAPGGKTTQIAGLLGPTGLLLANEPVPGRARILSQNVERLGVRNAIVTNERPERLAPRLGGFFHRVLVDAPCSGEGMFRREPASLDQWRPDAPEGCARRQLAILREAAGMVAPGGLLVYSTCTFNTTENEGVVERFLAEGEAFVAEDFALAGVGPSAAGCLRLWPHRLRGEGHFVARLRRAGTEPAVCGPGPGVALGTVDGALAGPVGAGRVEMAGETVWLRPVDGPGLDGLRVLREGLALGVRRGGRLSPHHAAAMAFPAEAWERSVALGEAEAGRYLHGETLPAPEGLAGWTVVSFAGLALGWGKCVQGTLKNHLPKGLRR